MRTILIFALGFVLYALVKGIFFREKLREARTKAPAKKEEARKSQGEEVVLDPVCGSYVPVSSSVIARINGEDLHFCSSVCRDAFSGGQKG